MRKFLDNNSCESVENNCEPTNIEHELQNSNYELTKTSRFDENSEIESYHSDGEISEVIQMFEWWCLNQMRDVVMGKT
jgi:hypothetical protein